MTPVDRQRLAELRQHYKNWCSHVGAEDENPGMFGDMGFLLRLLDAATAPPPASAMELEAEVWKQMQDDLHEVKKRMSLLALLTAALVAAAERRGAEQMREQAAAKAYEVSHGPYGSTAADAIRALPIDEPQP